MMDYLKEDIGYIFLILKTTELTVDIQYRDMNFGDIREESVSNKHL